MASATPSTRLRVACAASATIAAVELLVAAAATELCAAALFAAGRPLSGWVLAAGALAAALAAAIGAREHGLGAAAAATALALALVPVALALAASTYDISWDGQNYQQDGVIAIAQGWNPFGPPLPVARPYTAPFWVNHYAKGPWIRAAAVLLATGHVEAGKAWNFVLAAAAGLAALAAALRMPRVRAPFAVVVAALAILNPVFSSQMFTFYVDAQMASVLTAIVALVAAAGIAPGALPIVGLGSAFLLLPGIKFTGAAYAVLFGSLAALAVRVLDRRMAPRAVVAIACGTLVGALVTGWNPYVTNLVREGHPLYPVAGSHAFDVMSGQAPRAFLDRSRVAKLAIATFSASRNRNSDLPTLKWPFTWNGDETTLFQHPDARYGGFGPLFSGGLVLSAIALAVAVRRSRRDAAVGAVVAAALLATVVANPEGWWARYAPQLWLVPVALAVAAAAARGRAATIAAAVTLAVLGADAALVTVNAAHRLRAKSGEVEAQLRALSHESAPVVVQFVFDSNRRRFQEAGVPFVESDRLPCADPELLAYSKTRFCRPAREGAPARR